MGEKELLRTAEAQQRRLAQLLLDPRRAQHERTPADCTDAISRKYAGMVRQALHRLFPRFSRLRTIGDRALVNAYRGTGLRNQPRESLDAHFAVLQSLLPAQRRAAYLDLLLIERARFLVSLGPRFDGTDGEALRKRAWIDQPEVDRWDGRSVCCVRLRTDLLTTGPSLDPRKSRLLRGKQWIAAFYRRSHDRAVSVAYRELPIRHAR
jgi:hypothetical protein